MISEDNYRTIDELIRQNQSFALWRVPGENKVHFRMQTSGSAMQINSIEELNEQSGFVIAPFKASKKHPIILIQPDCFELPSLSEVCANQAPADDVSCSYETNNTTDEEASTEAEELKQYTHCFQLFTQPLLKGIQDKLVLSRKKIITRNSSFSPGEAFKAAVERYIRSYVYICHTPQTGTWMGGTPEIILSGENGNWQTVALAGTQPIHKGIIPQRWDDKNWREQQLVAFYIRRQLSSLGINPKEMGPYAIRAGEVSHLKSDFLFSLPDHKKLGNVLSLLHPTPAVCGLPKDEAYRFILENEGYDRSYYSGFIGWLDPEGKTDLYVNLRCMKISASTFTLFAGGGLLASSELESEWQETKDKLETMGRLLH